MKPKANALPTQVPLSSVVSIDGETLEVFERVREPELYFQEVHSDGNREHSRRACAGRDHRG